MPQFSRRHSARTGEALLRTGWSKLYDVQEHDVVLAPTPTFNSVRIRTTPPWRDVHRGVVARFFYHFQSRFFMVKRKFFWRLLVPVSQTILGSLVCCMTKTVPFDETVARHPGYELRVKGLGFRVRDQGLGFKFQESGFWVYEIKITDWGLPAALGGPPLACSAWQ